MKDLRMFSMLLLFLAGAIGLVSCNKDDEGTEPDMNIVEYLTANPEFSTLVAALSKAELSDDLGQGLFTFFAPDNEAFQDFFTSAGTGSLENTPKELLQDLLTYHLLQGEYASGDLRTGYTSTMSQLNGESNAFLTMQISRENGFVINGSVQVTRSDIDVNNGIIHVVDQVVALPTVLTFIQAEPQFSQLELALKRTDLGDFPNLLNGNGLFTIFAPTNDAFQALLRTNAGWTTVNDIPAGQLLEILKYHVVSSDNIRSNELTDGQSVKTLEGSNLTIDLALGEARIGTAQQSARIIFADIQADNGVMHAVDAILLPD